MNFSFSFRDTASLHRLLRGGTVGRKRWRPALACALLAGFTTTESARAVDYQWSAGTSSWFTSGNWTPAGPPTSVDNAFINNGGTAQITTAGAAAINLTLGSSGADVGTLQITGSGTLVMPNASSLIVGSFGNGTLFIQNGGTATSSGGTIAANTGSTGAVTVDGVDSTWTSKSGVNVGFSGTATLTIQNGGLVSSPSSIGSTIGFQAGSQGTVTVDGTGSTWSTSGDITVGFGGTGTLNIKNGGTVSNAIAGFIGAASMVTVNGVGSSWTNGSILYVGATFNSSTTGTLLIENGATVSSQAFQSNAGFVGDEGGTGAVTVDGAGSTWTANGDLTVGNSFGHGTLTIQNGGAVSDTSGFIGRGGFSTGTVTVDGAGSTWTNSASLSVGSSGTGSLTIQNGGTVSNMHGEIDPGGTVTVDGAGSTWTNSDLLVVGGSSLTIQNGGTVNASLSMTVGSTGLLQIGAAAVLNTPLLTFDGGTLRTLANITFSPNVVLGTDLGSGVIIDSDGHDSTVSGVFSGAGGLTKNGQGTVTLSGLNIYTGPTTINDGALAAGSGGAFSPNSAVILSAAGTLDLAGNDNTIGSLAGSGLVTDSVGGSALFIGQDNTNATFSGTISNLFSIDKIGTGTQTFSGVSPIDVNRLNIQQGTLALVNGSALSFATVFVGTATGETGTLLLDNSQLNNVNLIVGVTGHGILTLLHGATLTAAGGGPTIIGQFPGSSGTVNVMDGASTFTPAGPFLIGDEGSGTVNLSNGASITTNATAVGFDVGGSGLLNLDHATFNSDLLVVGNPGSGASGTLRVANGSTVTATHLVIGPTGTIELGANATFNVLPANFIFFGGTLRAIENATFANGAFITGDGIILDTAGPTGTLSGILTGDGGLTKTGPGKWIIEGAQQFMGNTVIDGGTLAVNGSIQSPQVLVNPLGTLGGSGTIFGNVTNSGTVSPGNSPGTLHINGSYTQTPSGTLSIQIASPTVFDQLIVGGHASIDGTLALSFAGFKPKRGESFQFLTANGGVTGQFARIISDTQFSLLTFSVINEGNALVLTTQTASFLQTLRGLTPNQTAVAASLDSALLDPRMNRIFDHLTTESLATVPRDLDRIAPEELTSIFTIEVSLAQVQSQNIQRRTDDLRSGSSGFNAAGLAINGGGPSYSGGFGITTGAAGPIGPMSPITPTSDAGKDMKETKEVAPAETRWGAFLSGTGEWVNVSGTDNARGYDLQSGGFTLGIDYKVCPNFAIGLMAGYTGTSADLTDHGRVYVNGGKIGIYATTYVGGWYADLAATGGYNSYDTRRSALQGEARGDTDGGELNALFGTGYDFKKGGLTFGPTATFNYTNIATNGFTEHGSLAPLDIHGGTGESLRTAFGLKASYDWKCGAVLIKPEIRAAWQHEYGDAAYALDSSFANGAGNSFLVNGPQLGRDSALLGAGFAIQFNERTSTYFYYDGEVGRKNYQSNSVTGGLRVTF